MIIRIIYSKTYYMSPPAVTVPRQNRIKKRIIYIDIYTYTSFVKLFFSSSDFSFLKSENKNETSSIKR